MAYTPTVWKNGEAPAINAENLNKIEQGIAGADSLASQALTQGLNLTVLYDGECTQNNAHNFTTAIPSDAKLILMFAQYNPYTEPGSGINPVPTSSTFQYSADVNIATNTNYVVLRYFISVNKANNTVSISCKRGFLNDSKALVFTEYPGNITRLFIAAI